MLIFIRRLLLLIFITFHISSNALTIEKYKKQYALVPCTGLETRIYSFEKMSEMMFSNASKKEKDNLNREYKALNTLYKKKKCHKRTPR